MAGRIKGCIFDFNGTLFQDTQFHIDMFQNDCVKKYGVPPMSVEQMVKTLFGMPNDALFKKYFKPDATDADVEEFVAFKEGRYRQKCLDNPDKFKLCDGAVELLDFLKAQGVPMCIATGSDLTNMKFFIEHLGIDRWFPLERIVYDDGTFVGKPAPDIYILAAKRLGLDPKECAVFEDGTGGLVAATRANIGKIFAVYEDFLPSPITSDTRVVKVFHDFRDIDGIAGELGLKK